ncbi:hypothetical protein T439DRAFT_325975 [Meredithblackwellia eburnea MCA 4105]
MGPFDGIVGAFLLGTLLNYILLGTTLVQTADYIRIYWATDKPVYRITVMGLLVLGLVHSAASGHIVYSTDVTHFGDVKHLTVIPWSFCIDPIVTAIIAAWVQLFYSYRVYTVGGRRILLPIIIVILTAFQLAWGIFCTVYAFGHPSYITIQKNLTFGVATWLVGMAVSDIVITGSLIWYLSRVRSDYSETNTIIDRVIRHIFANNAATAVTSCVSALAFAFGPGAWHVLAGLIISKLYQSSLLASLNGRRTIKNDLKASGVRQPYTTAAVFSPRINDVRSPRIGEGETPQMSAIHRGLQAIKRPSAAAFHSFSLSSLRSTDMGEHSNGTFGQHTRTVLPDGIPIHVTIESEQVDSRAESPWGAKHSAQHGSNSNLPSSRPSPEPSLLRMEVTPGSEKEIEI